MNSKPIIVISAVRYFQGGTIVIVDECLEYLSKNLSDAYDIKALVYKKEKYTLYEGIEYIEFPKARRSLYYRLYYEYVYFKKLSKKWKPFLWLSMQDSTPNVVAEKQAVYFHNPLLMSRDVSKLLFSQPRLFIIWLLYKTIYTKGISKNNFVIAQQRQWLELLHKRFFVPKSNLLLFPPQITSYEITSRLSNKYTFIFSGTALAHKNYDVIFRACEILNSKDVCYKMLFIISGKETNHFRKMKNKYKFPQIAFEKFTARKALFEYYNQSNCLIFPSLLETWGLPLSEFALQNKPIICADLPYAKETLANYDKVKFFNPYNAEILATLMFQAIKGELLFDKNPFEYDEKIIGSWKEMFDTILKSV